MISSLVRTEPLFGELSLLPKMDDMLGHFFNRSTDSVLPIDVYERAGSYVIKASVPGVNREDLEIKIENRNLTVSGEVKQELLGEHARVYSREIRYGTFRRSVRLPSDAQPEEARAEFNNGNVYITVPRTPAPETKALVVPIS